MSSSVRLSSVMFVRPTQAIKILGNVSTPFGTLATHDLSVKLLRRSFQRNPSVGGVKHKTGSRISLYSAILDLSTAISKKRCKRR